MQERCLFHVKADRLWPWLVASAAIHGLLLVYWLNPALPVKSSPADDVVLELMSVDTEAEKRDSRPISDAIPEQKKIPFHPIRKTVAKTVVSRQRVKVSAPVLSRPDAHGLFPVKKPAAKISHRPVRTDAASVTRQPVPIHIATITQKPAVTSQSEQSAQSTQSASINMETTQQLVRSHLEAFKYYPSSARRRGIEGRVEVGFTLLRDGAAAQVSVLRGSGYAILDHAALETVYRAQPFPVEDGKYRFSLRFKRL